jgi:hypothetical protein
MVVHASGRTRAVVEEPLPDDLRRRTLEVRRVYPPWARED